MLVRHRNGNFGKFPGVVVSVQSDPGKLTENPDFAGMCVAWATGFCLKGPA
jgi:hypothetical protein